MQQTEKYELNKPGVDDPIAIAPLNENMDKVEAALAAETAARQSADVDETAARQSADTAEAQARKSADTAETQARTAADTALGNRVTVLEGHKVRMACGTYTGNDSKSRTISIGFKPKAVLIELTKYKTVWVAGATPYKDVAGVTTIQFVDNGFVINGESNTAINLSGGMYHYVAFG